MTQNTVSTPRITGGSQHSRSLVRIAAIVALISVPMSGAREFPDYPVKNEIQSYTIRGSKSGLTVALEPISDPADQKKFFDFDFVTQGLLPVLVVLKNDASDASLLLRREDLAFGPATDTQKTTSGGSLVGVDAGNKEFAAASVLGGVPLALVAFGKVAKAAEVRQNLIRRELRSQTLGPGQQTSGFLYIPIGKAKTRSKIALRVRASQPGSNEQAEIEVVF